MAGRYGMTLAELQVAIRAGNLPRPTEMPQYVDGSLACIPLDDDFLMETEDSTDSCVSEGGSATSQQADETIEFGRDEFEDPLADLSEHEGNLCEASRC